MSKFNLVTPVDPTAPLSIVTPVAAFRLSDHDKQYLEQIAQDFPCPDNIEYQHLLPFIIMMQTALPSTLKLFLVSLAMEPTAEAFGIIQNSPRSGSNFASEYFMLAIALTMGGRAIAQKNEAGEQIIQRITPQKNAAQSQTSSSYATMLGYHGDDFASGLHRNAWTMPFVSSRPAQSPSTYMADMRSVCESLRQAGRSDIIEMARRNRIIPLYPESQRGNDLSDDLSNAQGSACNIISGPEGQEYIAAEYLGDTIVFPDDNVDDRNMVQLVLEVIREHIERVAVSVELAAGDLGLFSNQKGFHARGKFPQGYDPEKETPRELIRIHVVMDPWHSRNLNGHLI